MMSLFGRLFAIGVLSVILLEPSLAFYQCGIRKRSLVPLIAHGLIAQEKQWPWHVAVFHKYGNRPAQYACGGSLLDEKHILTSAHCVVNPETLYGLPENIFELHLGQQNLSTITSNVQIRDVRRVYVHPEYSEHRNDIAILEMRLPVQYNEYVIPICIDQTADKDLRNLVGKRGWIAGWGRTQTGSRPDALQTASLPVVSYVECISDGWTFNEKLLTPNVFCAGDRNGTSASTGDSGSGMYFSDGDRWVLRGIISFAKQDNLHLEVDDDAFVVFVNVQRYLTWIRQTIDKRGRLSKNAPKRISERECERFQGLARKRRNNICNNSRYPHSVSLNSRHGKMLCNGVLVTESHVLTACQCIKHNRVRQVHVDTYGSINVSDMECHPDYEFGSLENDVGILKLSAPMQLSSSLIPACLANNWTENLYDTLLQTGYAMSLDTGSRRYIDSEENFILSDEQCAVPLVDGTYYIPDGQLCVQNTDQFRTTIHGAAGAPLQSVNTRSCMFTVVGIIHSVQIFDTNGNSNISMVEYYTRISHHLDWIEQVIWDTD